MKGVVKNVREIIKTIEFKRIPGMEEQIEQTYYDLASKPDQERTIIICAALLLLFRPLPTKYFKRLIYEVYYIVNIFWISATKYYKKEGK